MIPKETYAGCQISDVEVHREYIISLGVNWGWFFVYLCLNIYKLFLGKITSLLLQKRNILYHNCK